jgi:hypothetical protein
MQLEGRGGIRLRGSRLKHISVDGTGQSRQSGDTLGIVRVGTLNGESVDQRAGDAAAIDSCSCRPLKPNSLSKQGFCLKTFFDW